MLLGGRTTPRDRVDLGLGAAMRVPLADLEPRAMPEGAEEVLAFAEPGGVAPVALARWGFVRHGSLGLSASGSTARVELIGEVRLSPFLRLMYGVAPYGGYAWSNPRQGTGGGEGWRVGALAPIALTMDGAGIIEGWVGARLGFEHADGSIGVEMMRSAGHLSAFRGGVFLGLAAGIRRVHVMIELAADYEYWVGALGGMAIERQGVALTPGVALRIRL